MDLLLYLSEYQYTHKNAICASLAWICKLKNHSFDIYYEAQRSGEAYGGPPAVKEDYFGSTVMGGHHYEQFFLLNKLFNVKYAMSGNPVTFSPYINEREKIVQTDSVSKFYREVFSYFNLKIPTEAVIIGTSSTSTLELDPFCYPEIYYRNAIGVASEIGVTELIELEKMGIQKFYAVYVSYEKIKLLESLGLEVEVVDDLTVSDYRTALTRLAQRWLNRAKGFMLGDPVLVSYWIPWCCSNDVISVSEISVIDALAKKSSIYLKNMSKVIFGRQSSEQDILNLSRHDFCFQIIDPGRPVFSVLEKTKGRLYEPEESYSDHEPSDAELESYAKEKKILSSILFWCPDLRHAECVYRILDLITVANVKIGIGITAYWYKYFTPLLHIINIPLESGGVYPNIEPLLCSCGLGVASEAKGYMSHDTILSNLRRAKEMILARVSEKFLPKGCYPFLDIRQVFRLKFHKSPPFIRRVITPSEEINDSFMHALIEVGLEYVVSLADASVGKPKVTFRKGDFAAINYTAGRWMGVSPYITTRSVNDIKLAEKELRSSERPGWILSAIDSPLWLLSKPAWQSSCRLWEIVDYMRSGGISKKLVNVTPHTILRYAKILEDEGLL